MILFGVCLGALAAGIGLRFLGVEREIWQHILMMGLFFALSLVFHNCWAVRSQETGENYDSSDI
jgi:hypothetical protein